MEMVIVGNNNTDWFKQCREYLTCKQRNREKVNKFCESHNIKLEDWLCNSHTIYIRRTKDNKRYAGQAKKDLYYQDDEPFYVIKKNSLLGKEFNMLDLEVLNKPMVGWGLLDDESSIRGLRYSQFIYEDSIYILLDYDKHINIPAGFTEMKMSDYYLMLERIRNPDNNLYLENVN
jgi:hypothetical protein